MLEPEPRGRRRLAECRRSTEVHGGEWPWFGGGCATGWFMRWRLARITIYNVWFFQSFKQFSRFTCFGTFWFGSWIHLLMECVLGFVMDLLILTTINMYLFYYYSVTILRTLGMKTKNKGSRFLGNL